MNQTDCNCGPSFEQTGNAHIDIQGPSGYISIPQFQFTHEHAQLAVPMSIVLRGAAKYLMSPLHSKGERYICDALDEVANRNDMARVTCYLLKDFIRFKLNQLAPGHRTLYGAHYRSHKLELQPREGVEDPEWFLIRDKYLEQWFVELKAKGY